MLADAGADVVVADAHEADGLGGIVGQTVCTDSLGQFIAGDELEGDGQVFVDEFVHPALYLLLLLARWLVVEIETHLALLPLDVGIITPLAAEQADHRLVQQVLSGVSGRELFLVMVIQDVVHWLDIML